MARIMIVGESSLMRKRIGILLKGAGHDVVSELSSGFNAYNEYEKLKPDIITMDITSSEGSAIEAISQITNKYPDAKIIMISSTEQLGMTLSALESGALHYIVRPFKDEEVIDRVNQVLSETMQIDIKVENDESNAYDSKTEDFYIENRNGVFILKISSLIENGNMDLINKALQGLRYIRPLKVILDFGDMQQFGSGSFNKVKEVFTTVNSIGGELRIVTGNYNILEFIKDRNIKIKPENVYSNIFEVHF